MKKPKIETWMATEENFEEIAIRDNDDRLIATVHRAGYDNTDDSVISYEDGTKNATLISTAPEILDALQQVTDMYETAMNGKYDDPDEAEVIDKARAAIAKARGIK